MLYKLKLLSDEYRSRNIALHIDINSISAIEIIYVRIGDNYGRLLLKGTSNTYNVSEDDANKLIEDINTLNNMEVV